MVGQKLVKPISPTKTSQQSSCIVTVPNINSDLPGKLPIEQKYTKLEDINFTLLATKVVQDQPNDSLAATSNDSAT